MFTSGGLDRKSSTLRKQAPVQNPDRDAVEACIGLAVPGRPIGPWSRRTGNTVRRPRPDGTADPAQESANLSCAMVAIWDCALGRTGTPATPQNKIVPNRKGVAVDIIGLIIAGIIIGLLGKFFAPGNRDNIPLWLTIVCGIGGVLIGYYLAAALGVDATRGIDWTRWIISIVVAAVLVMIAASVTARRGRTI